MLVDRHAHPLGLIHGYVENGLASAYDCLHRLCKPGELLGPTLAAALRQAVIVQLASPAFAACAIRSDLRPNTGVWLSCRGYTLRLLKRPETTLTSTPTSGAAPQDPLPGCEAETAPAFRYAILWSPNPKAKCLDRVVLAAISEDPRGQMFIHAEVELPRTTTVSPTQPATARDDFDQYWRDDARRDAPGDM